MRRSYHQMVKAATDNESAITCHATLGQEEAVCAGFYRLYPTLPLRVAAALNVITFE